MAKIVVDSVRAAAFTLSGSTIVVGAENNTQDRIPPPAKAMGHNLIMALRDALELSMDQPSANPFQKGHSKLRVKRVV